MGNEAKIQQASGRALAFSPISSVPADKLRPVEKKQFAAELIACLTLVAPIGFSEDARREWLRVAHATLGHLPSDLLRAGCEIARKEATHFSQIVPIITGVAEPLLRSRKEPDPYRIPTERRLEAPNNPTKDEVDAILRKFGHADVAAKLEARGKKDEAKANRGAPRSPTREDYLAMGVPEENIPAHAGGPTAHG